MWRSLFPSQGQRAHSVNRGHADAPEAGKGLTSFSICRTVADFSVCEANIFLLFDTVGLYPRQIKQGPAGASGSSGPCGRQ